MTREHGDAQTAPQDGHPAPDPSVETGAANMPLPGHPMTGDPAIDAALTRLRDVADAPLEEQLENAEQVHRILQGRLADLGGA